MGKQRKSFITLAVLIVIILISSVFSFAIQANWGRVKVSDLRYAKNSGPWTKDQKIQVQGSVVSGLLFVPKGANAGHKLPAVVLTHGYLNNREFMVPEATELARRGFVVLAIDREGHGNYDSTNQAGNSKGSLFSRGLYDAAKYLYNLNYVDKSKIGISGHSMGGFDTAATLMEDSSNVAKLAKTTTLGAFTGDVAKPNLDPQDGYGLGIISAGLMQGWDTFNGANQNVSVGINKANDDEFFFGGNSWSNPGNTLADGTPSLSRQFLNSVNGATFIGIPAKGSINIQNGGIYIDGKLKNIQDGKAANAPFRVIYQHNEIHPLNTWSFGTTKSVTNFFYTAFGTPNGASYISSGNEVWWIQAVFSFIGLLAFFALIFPLANLFLSIPFFAGLRKTKSDHEEVGTELKGLQKHLSYWITGIAVTLFAGFSLRSFATGLGTYWFPLTQRYPQDTTNWIVIWAIAVGLFALAISLVVWGINALINTARFGKNSALLNNSNPLATAQIKGGLGSLARTLLLAALIIGTVYSVLYIVWGLWKVDFRIWTFDVKVFDVPALLPTMLRYAVLFGIFWCLNSILNQNYKVKNLPEWATVTINIFFNMFGVLLVILIQYIHFKSTGTLWQPSMNLGYIVAMPLVPILIIATIISRHFYKLTGNAWLGGFVNTLLFTVITCANTATSFHYILG